MVLNGTGNGIENSQCKINAAGTSAAPNGNSLKLTLNVMFKAAFAGNKVFFVAGRDRADGNNTDSRAGAASGYRTYPLVGTDRRASRVT